MNELTCNDLPMSDYFHLLHLGRFLGNTKFSSSEKKKKFDDKYSFIVKLIKVSV